MTNKTAIKFNQRLSKINSGTFDEDDIKLLLIEIRDDLKSESILREVCDFIAHPKRNKGICHARIDSRYAKQMFIKKGTDQLVRDKVFELNPDKPWGFFSDRILGYIQTDKIDKKLFEIIIKEGLEEIDDELFQKHIGLSKDKVRFVVSNFYEKNNGEYQLKNGLSEEVRLQIDNLLKFIRGTVTGKSAFDQVEIENDILNAIERLAKSLLINVDLVEFKKHLSDIIVCILCLINQTNFELFDKTVGKSYLSIHPDQDNQKFKLGLIINTDNFIFQIISTTVYAKDYIVGIDDKELQTFIMEPIPWCFSLRDTDKKLRLTKNDV